MWVLIAFGSMDNPSSQSIQATVLLNANVAFLAIQSVDEASSSPSRSAAQITSYLSVITSIGSIILGLLLVRQNRSKAKETSRDAVRLFLSNRITGR